MTADSGAEERGHVRHHQHQRDDPDHQPRPRLHELVRQPNSVRFSVGPLPQGFPQSYQLRECPERSESASLSTSINHSETSS